MVVLLLLATVALANPVYKDPMINEGLFEGDIMGVDPSGDRNAVVLDSQRWPRGVVPYVISPESENLRALIMKAMRYIEQVSCIRFTQRQFERDYIKIIKHTGCYSHWGRIGGEQPLSLGTGCENFAVIIHELMHAIGFEHEHNRSDRDNHLIINWHNIEKKWYFAFRKLRPEENRILSAFDFNSIMLYGSRSFAKDYWSDNYSMVAKDGKFIPEIYDKNSMSASDIKRIKTLYNC